MSNDLRDLLALERLEENLFRGFNPVSERTRIYGGQVIAQALLAAFATVDEARLCHSLHAYFIRPGDPAIPIVFDVDRARDGKSFTTRRVVAIQHGRQILNMAASFQVAEPGFDHQLEMPQAPGPDGYPELMELRADLAEQRTGARPDPATLSPVEMRFIEPNEVAAAGAPPGLARRRAWFRLRTPIADDPRWEQVALAYASDMALITAALQPHGVLWSLPEMQSASLDHALWFHRRTNVSGWHLYDMDSPSASGARGFNRGSIFRADRTLAASAAQEGLIRYHGAK